MVIAMFRIFAILALVVVSACSTQGPSDTAKLLAYDELITTPGYAWFPAEVAAYTPNPAMVDTVAKYYRQSEQKVIVFIKPNCDCMGSKQLFPRAVKTLMEAGVDVKDLEFWSMRGTSDMNPYTSSIALTGLPTIVVMRNGTESGRIEESNFTESNADSLMAYAIARQ